MTERQVIESFKAMCQSSIDPESYDILENKIIPQLENNRSDLENMSPTHKSDCSVNNGPAYTPGPCDCGFDK